MRYRSESNYRFLAVKPAHAAAVEDLAVHHADPFDRILIAEAPVEPLHLITHDPIVARYSEAIIAV